MLKGVTLTVNYPDDSVEAAIPERWTAIAVGHFIAKLIESEPEATSFVLVAAIDRGERSDG